MKNLEIAKILNNIADILELKEVQFKPFAYRKAARAIETLPEDIADILERGELQDIPGVGKHIAAKIEEFLQTGKIKAYQQLKKQIKVNIEELNSIPGLGPKKIKVLYKKLKIKNIKDLEKAAKANQIRKLPGFGEETEKIFLRGIQFVKSHPKRFLYAHTLPIVNQIIDNFSRYDFVDKIEVAGSFRRGKETVGDLDFLVISKQPEKVTKAFLAMPDVKTVTAKGRTKSSVRLTNGLQIDLRVLKEKEWGSALNYFIGSKQHNIELRKFALKKGYTLSEYGLFKVGGKGKNKSKKWVAGRTEAEIYKKLGLQFIPPELRENTGEIEAARQHKLPKLVELKDVKGLFHNHTNWSDGGDTLLEMSQAAKKMKFKFISFNDHVSDIGITHPLDQKRLVKYLKEIAKVKKKVKRINIFSGVEIDILKDGSLDLSPKKLKKLDVVIAAVHMSRKMSAEGMTDRICQVLKNYPVNILAHPLGRLLNQRESLKLNFDKIFKTAKENNVFLEINASPQRMDLPGELVKAGKKAGCKFAISTDAHSTDALEHYPLAVNMARRGWLEKKDVLNCWDFGKIGQGLGKS